LYTRGSAEEVANRTTEIRQSIGIFTLEIEAVLGAVPYSEPSNFTSQSYTAVVQALNMSRATSSEQATFINTAQTAIHGLTDVRELRALLGSIAQSYASGNFQITPTLYLPSGTVTYNPNNFTTTSHNNLQNRLNAVRNLNILSSGTSEQIRIMINDIEEARDNLILVIWNDINLRDLLYVSCVIEIKEPLDSPDPDISSGPITRVGGSTSITNTGDRKFSVGTWTAFIQARNAAIMAVNNATSEAQIQTAIEDLINAHMTFRYSDPIRLSHLRTAVREIINELTGASHPASTTIAQLNTFWTTFRTSPGAAVYTPLSFTRFTQAMNSAFAADGFLDGRDLEIGFNETIYYELYESFASLRLVGNKVELSDLYYNDMLPRGYQQSFFLSGFTTYSDALIHAKAVLDNGEAIQSEIDYARDALTAAFAALRVNRAELEHLIGMADRFDEANYTEEQWTAFEEALEAAEGVTSLVVYEEYFEILTDLVNAMKELALQDLQEVYTRVEEYQETDFTSGFAAFAAARTNAQEILETPEEFTIQQILNALIALELAIDNLVVNMTALVHLVEAIETNPSEYIESMFGAYFGQFELALDNAQQALEKGSALTLEEYRTALSGLLSALTHRQLFKDDLLAEIANIENFIEENRHYYSKSSIGTLENAASRAEALAHNAVARQYDIDRETEALQLLLVQASDEANLSAWYILELIARDIDPVRNKFNSYRTYLVVVEEARDYANIGEFTLEGVKYHINKLLGTLEKNYIDDGSEFDTSDVDKTLLYLEILRFESLPDDPYYSGYTRASIEAYNDYIVNVLIPIFDLPSASTGNVEFTLLNLPKLVVDKAPLILAIESGDTYVEEIGANRFTADSLAVYNAAREAAQFVRDNANATVGDVRRATLDLLNATENLELRQLPSISTEMIIIGAIVLLALVLAIACIILLKRRKRRV
jgi:hypothetical protein